MGTSQKDSKKHLNYFKDQVFLKKFAEGFRKKVRDNWDVVIVITGYNGVGKSSLAWALSTLIDDAFDETKQVLWSEGSEQAINLIQEMDNYKVIWYDEAVHQFSNDEWFSKGSKDFSKEYTINRSENKVHILCIPDFEKLTKYMRDYRVKYHFHVYDRGKALFRMKDTTNPVKKSSWNDEFLRKYLEKKFYSKSKSPNTNDIIKAWKKMSNAHKKIVRFPKMPTGVENKYNRLKDQRKRKNASNVEIKIHPMLEKLRKYILDISTDIQTKDLALAIGIGERTVYRWRQKYKPVSVPEDTKRLYNNNKLKISADNNKASPYVNKGNQLNEEKND